MYTKQILFKFELLFYDDSEENLLQVYTIIDLIYSKPRLNKTNIYINYYSGLRSSDDIPLLLS
jgi:hypothetical protein